MQITLRFPTPDDGPAVAEAVQESMAELGPWMAWCHPGFGLDDAMGWIGSHPAAREQGTAFEFVIIGQDGRLLGSAGLNGVRAEHRFANLGYWVRTSATRRGVASQAVRLVAEWAWANTDFERLEIVAAAGNVSSQRAAVKAGAMREGVLRRRLLVRDVFHDAVMHSIVRP